MNRKVIAVTILLVLAMLLAIGYVSAASISATLTVQQSGSDVITAPQGSSVNLLCSFTISPSATATGTVSYRYSADGITFGPDTTITTINNWDGSQNTVPFTLTQSGYYVFFLKVESGFDSATTHYPASGTFNSSPPPSVLPEAPPIAGLAIGFAAVGLFVVVAKKKKPKTSN